MAGDERAIPPAAVATGCGRVAAPAAPDRWPAGRRGGAVRPRRHARARRALQRRPGAGATRCRARSTALDRLRAAGVPVGGGDQPVRASAAGLVGRGPGRRGQRPGRGAARPVRHAGSSARTHRRAGCGCRKPRARPGAAPPRRALGVAAARVRAGRRHRRGRRRRPGGRRPRGAGADAGDPAGGGARRARPSPPTCRPRSSSPWPARGVGDDAGCWWSGWTATATCCWPARPSAPSPPAADGSMLLVGPRGRQAAALLPGVDEILDLRRCRGSTRRPHPVDAADVDRLVAQLRAARVVRPGGRPHLVPPVRRCRWRCCCGWPASPRSRAISEDYPGSLLDVRPPTSPTDAARGGARAVARRRRRVPAARGDDGRLRLRDPRLPPVAASTGRPVRGAAPRRVGAGPGLPAAAVRAAIVAALIADGRHRVVVTGGPRRGGAHRRGRRRRRAPTSAAAPTWPGWPACSRGAAAVVVGNTGPAHLAAAVGTPVVSLFAPIVPAGAGRPYGVPRRAARRRSTRACRGTRATRLPGPRPPLPGRRSPRSQVVAAVGARCRVRRPSARSAGVNDPALARARLLDHRVRPGPPRYLVPVAAGPRAGRPGPGPDLRLAGVGARGHAGAAAADEPVDLVVLQRPARVRAGRPLARPPPGPRPAGRLRRAQRPAAATSPRTRHPLADRDDLLARARHPLQRAVLGHRPDPHHRDRARRGRPRVHCGPASWPARPWSSTSRPAAAGSPAPTCSSSSPGSRRSTCSAWRGRPASAWAAGRARPAAVRAARRGSLAGGCTCTCAAGRPSGSA